MHFLYVAVQWVSQNFDASTNKFLNKNMIPGHLSASYRYLMMVSNFIPEQEHSPQRQLQISYDGE